MNIDIALKIFALGVKFGERQSQLGMVIKDQTDERLDDILRQGFSENINELEQYAKALDRKVHLLSWYTANWTAKQSYRFGCLAGFEEWPKTMMDKKGTKILTEEAIDKLVQLQFRQCKPLNETI